MNGYIQIIRVLENWDMKSYINSEFSQTSEYDRIEKEKDPYFRL